MEGHKEWLQAGFDKGIFLLSGSLQPNAGGGIVAVKVSKEEIEEIVAEDPFVIENVVKPEIIELTPSKADDRLLFLID
ncbi:YciI family protein [Pseudoalteromonas galatheae]|uniref:YciI family protein n=2 Tax=Pseudoalteromonas TaxID=53246 RepID=UPI001ADE2D71|nr:GTP cyclohydrolase [Pseudoalteromonas galatheae]